MTARRADRLALVVLAGATVVSTWPLLARPQGLPPPVRSAPGADIWSHFLYSAFDFLAVHRFGQFPFRSPYHTGGYPLYAHPDDLSLSPRMALVLATGPWATLKLEYVLTMFLAAAGTYVLARRQLDFTAAGALVSALVFATGGSFLERWIEGLVIYTRGLVFPWLLYFWFRAREDRRYLAACGAVMALLLLDAKYALVHVTWFAVLWTALRLDRRRGGPITDPVEPRRFLLWGLLVVWAVLLAGVKIVPMIPLLEEHFEQGWQGQPVSVRQTALWLAVLSAVALGPRAARLADRRHAAAAAAAVVLAALALLFLLVPRDDSTPPERLEWARQTWRGLTSFGTIRPVPGSDEVEVRASVMSSPVGWVGLALAAAGLLAWGRRALPWLLLMILLLWIDLGKAVPLDLQSGVRRIPGLSVLRKVRPHLSPYLAFTLALLAGRGAMAAAWWFGARGKGDGSLLPVGPEGAPVERPARKRLPSPRRWAQTIPVGLGALHLAVFTWCAWPWYRYSVSADRPPLGPPEKEFYLLPASTGPDEHLALLMYRNVGLLEWDVNFRRRPWAVRARSEHVGGPLLEGYRGELWFWDETAGNRAEFTHFTPLRMRIKVTLRRPGTLVINQVKDPNWRVSEGRLSSYSHALGVDLDRLGEYELSLWYVPASFYWGLGVSAVALVGGLAVLMRKPRRSLPAPEVAARLPGPRGAGR